MKDKLFMSMAESMAKCSPDIKRQVGAVIIKEDKVISMGFNQPIPNKIIENYFCQSKQPFMVHAEMDAILKANIFDREGASMYITLAPCPECSKIIAASKIKKVFYKEDHKDANLNFFKDLGIEVRKYKEKL